MGIRDFKLDLNAVNNGVWFNYPPNKDGSIPRVLLARANEANEKFTAKMAEVTKPHLREIELGTFSKEKDRELTLEAWLGTVLLDWENIQPDDNGEAIDFKNKAAVKALLLDLAWLDFYVDMRSKAVTANNFRAGDLEIAAKN